MTTSQYTNTTVITVSSVSARDNLIKDIYTDLTKEPSTQFTIVQSQANKIQIFHNAENGIKVLIRTYLVVVIPVLINLEPLNKIYGYVDYQLNDTINLLYAQIDKLKSLQNRKFFKRDRSSKLKVFSELGDFND